MRLPGSRLRSVALAATAALGLHELRSEVGLGSHAHAELAEHAHGYLVPVTLAVGALLAIAAAHLAASLACSAWRSPGSVRHAPADALRLWRLAAGGLLSVCLVQELLESLVATGRPVDLAAMLEHGGWTAVPLAALFGGAVVLGVRGSDIAIELIEGRDRPRVVAVSPSRCRVGPRPGHSRAPEPLANLVGRRAPPVSALAH